jgi:2-dehydro-3-deoxyphosphogluconate aldolase/(4S)-4-hydroxy-2-oxoglutarate aldolase
MRSNKDEPTGTMTSLIETLHSNSVIPLIQAETAETAVAIAQALKEAGMPVVEVVQRTDRSLECLRAIAHQVEDLIVGAGTVLSTEQALACMDAGARFIVSPGLDQAIVEAVQSRQIDVVPGIMTPTELQHAHRLGLRLVKFFPASTAGGIPGLKALSSVFRDMRFVPTGGISAANLAEYLAQPAVIACGGSWMTPEQAIARGDFEQIAALARVALDIARNAARH